MDGLIFERAVGVHDVQISGSGQRSTDELHLIGVSAQPVTKRNSSELEAGSSRRPAAPVRQRVAQLLPEPRVVVFDVRVGLDVVPHGAAHRVLARQVAEDNENDLLPGMGRLELELGPLRRDVVVRQDNLKINFLLSLIIKNAKVAQQM